MERLGFCSWSLKIHSCILVWVIVFWVFGGIVWLKMSKGLGLGLGKRTQAGAVDARRRYVVQVFSPENSLD